MEWSLVITDTKSHLTGSLDLDDVSSTHLPRWQSEDVVETERMMKHVADTIFIRHYWNSHLDWFRNSKNKTKNDWNFKPSWEHETMLHPQLSCPILRPAPPLQCRIHPAKYQLTVRSMNECKFLYCSLIGKNKIISYVGDIPLIIWKLFVLCTVQCNWIISSNLLWKTSWPYLPLWTH